MLRCNIPAFVHCVILWKGTGDWNFTKIVHTLPSQKTTNLFKSRNWIIESIANRGNTWNMPNVFYILHNYSPSKPFFLISVLLWNMMNSAGTGNLDLDIRDISLHRDCKIAIRHCGMRRLYDIHWQTVLSAIANCWKASLSDVIT